jgi:alanyl-tRNA synthetase
VFPSNEGRGYVLRRILRRAIRHAYRLGTEKNIMGQMVDVAIGVMGEAYPDVVEKRERIIDIVEREEFKFRQTLKTGNAMLEDEFDSLKKGEALNGAIAFKLHDTYGFPLELTKEIAEERGLGLDQPGFDAAMANQVSMAQAARKNSKTPEALSDQYRAVMEANGTTTFIGYTETEANDATVLAVVEADENGIVEIFLDRTPFYAESGGQVGDTGTIATSDGEAVVEDTTYAIPGLVRHSARIVSGSIEPNTKARAHINVEKRDATRKNHTATHLIHHALREVLGDHVKQQGSLVGPDRLRFDFFHFDPLTSAQTSQIEDIVNGIVLTGKAALNEEKTKAEAEAMGAIAFFGDKYGDRVRILLAGPSLEFCGGTHVRNVGEIGAVKIVSEGSIGSNVRRIEATTGMQTITKLRHDESLLGAASASLRVKPEELPSRIEKMLEERKDLERQIADLKRASAGSRAAEFAAKAVNGFVIDRVDDLDRDGLKDLAVAIRDLPGIRAVVLGGAPATGGVTLVSVVKADSGLVASDLLAEAAKMVGGGAGKGPEIAIAGGKKPEELDNALGWMRVQAEK